MVVPAADLGCGVTIAEVEELIAEAFDQFDYKDSVRVATTVAGTLATSFENGDTIDGVVLATGDRILIKNQVAGAANGIYVVNASGAPTRAADAATSADVTAGMVVPVELGTAQAESIWLLVTPNPITLGTTPLTFNAVDFLGDGSVTNAKLADMAAATIKGRALGAGTGVPTDLTAAQVGDILFPVWTAWTPTVRFGSVVADLGAAPNGQYLLLGKTCIFNIQVTAGTIVGTPSGTMSFDMPVGVAPFAIPTLVNGTGWILDPGVGPPGTASPFFGTPVFHSATFFGQGSDDRLIVLNHAIDLAGALTVPEGLAEVVWTDAVPAALGTGVEFYVNGMFQTA